MRGLYILIAFSTFFFFSGCVEKSGYYTEGEDSVISLICDVTWASDKVVNDAEETIQGIYQFKRDGTCTQTSIVTDKDGKEHKTEVYVKWVFYDQSSSIIYFGTNHYWDIEELTAGKFAIYDRWGEYGEMNMSREYKELTPLK